MVSLMIKINYLVKINILSKFIKWLMAAMFLFKILITFKNFEQAFLASFSRFSQSLSFNKGNFIA